MAVLLCASFYVILCVVLIDTCLSTGPLDMISMHYEIPLLAVGMATRKDPRDIGILKVLKQYKGTCRL